MVLLQVRDAGVFEELEFVVIELLQHKASLRSVRPVVEGAFYYARCHLNQKRTYK